MVIKQKKILISGKFNDHHVLMLISYKWIKILKATSNKVLHKKAILVEDIRTACCQLSPI